VCGPVCSTLGFRRRAVIAAHLVVVGVRSSGATWKSIVDVSRRACMCGPVCSTLGFRRRVVVVAHLKSTLVVVGVRSSGASCRPRRGSPSSMSQGVCVCGRVCATLGFRRRVVVAAHLKSTLVVVGGPVERRVRSPSTWKSIVDVSRRVCVDLSVPCSGSVAESW